MRNLYRPVISAAICLTIAACGDGGGGIASTPAPPAAPTPTPTNTSLANLTYNQVFATNAASATTALDTSAKLVVGASTTTPSTIQVSYDASAKSYTITGASRSQTFAVADIQTGTNPGETRYFKTDGTNRDYLTLAVTPYTSTTANNYVGLGYWQRNVVTGTTQNTTFDSFVYGFDTAASAVPRNGSAGYVTDALGFVTTPGKTPRAFTGPGTFNVDLALGVFATHSSVVEYNLTDSGATSGGGIEFTGGGHLTSGNGFAGNFTYGGFDTRVSGTIAGRFFGPAAQELGASFSANDGAGSAVTGSLTGQQSASVTPINLSLPNFVSDQLFYSNQAMLETQRSGASNIYNGIGQLTRRADGSFSLTAATSQYAASSFTSADQVTDSRANFTSYQKVVNGQTLRISFYKPGAANTELALTYASFGSSVGGASPGYGAFDGRYYFIYGIETPTSLLARRTGSASYTGVAYGAGVRTDGLVYDVRGTSQYAVDFTGQKYSGSLALNGTPTTGTTATDLGTWSFAGALTSGQLNQTGLSRADGAIGQIVSRFYGPDGEEIAATFSAMTGAQSAANTVAIVGATVAKRP